MFVQGYFPRAVTAVRSGRVLNGWVDGNSSVPEQVRWNGTEERPEWGASPEKPSKPLRFDTESCVLSLGVRTESLAGSLRIRSYLSAFVCALAFLVARSARASQRCLRAKLGGPAKEIFSRAAQ